MKNILFCPFWPNLETSPAQVLASPVPSPLFPFLPAHRPTARWPAPPFSFLVRQPAPAPARCSACHAQALGLQRASPPTQPAPRQPPQRLWPHALVGPLVSVHPHALLFSPQRRWPRLSAARRPLPSPSFSFPLPFLPPPRQWRGSDGRPPAPTWKVPNHSAPLPFLVRRSRPPIKTRAGRPPSPFSPTAARARTARRRNTPTSALTSTPTCPIDPPYSPAPVGTVISRF